MTATALIIDSATDLYPEIARLTESSDLFSEVTVVPTRQQALRHLQERPVDLLFFSWTQTTWQSGLELLKKLHKRDAWKDIPFLVCADGSAAETVSRAFDQGASDCLHLPGSRQEALARIRSRLRQKEQTDAMRKEMSQLARMAVTDLLTGLYNRAYFDATIELETVRSQRTGHSFSLLLIDLDHFKRINDTYGHPVGDDVIRTVAAMLQETARKSDVVCRYGGEEFAILLPGTTAPTALQIAERLRKKIAAIAPGYLPIRCPLTVSIGISCTSGQPDISAGRLIEEADCALYACKQNGRNRTELFARAQESIPHPQPFPCSSLAAGHA